MINTSLKVARHEFLSYVRKPSFIITTLLIPLIALAVTFFMGRQGDAVENSAESLQQQMEESAADATNRFGIVDESGLLVEIPPQLSTVLTHYEGQSEAEAALKAGELDAIYLVAPDYLETGDVTRIGRRFDFFAGDTAIVAQALSYNLTQQGDPAKLALISIPLPNVETENIGTRTADQVGGDQAEGIAFVLAYVLAFLLYTTIIASASYLLQSVTLEKESRMIEMILTSLRPIELLTGKVLGLGLLGLLQVVFWGASAALIAAFGPMALPALGDLGITWQLGLLILAYFLLGYGINAVLMSGLGALVPSVKESGPATLIMVLPLVIPLMFMATITEAPHEPLAVGLSIFPLTAPVAMMIRLAQGGVPAWQLAVSIALGALTIPLLMQGAARLFRAQTLLNSEGFSMKRLVATLREAA
ncbi:MAG: ABC transporter permease [Anaerolineales bacterium]|nr:ABC transporter permease [Anaerolineales bacterium]MCB9127360.1 ABC transporter permease [Ardenticatenales bacterium]MCB9172695.1 ABC transporter permease [Ardenticatenales bacterium]